MSTSLPDLAGVVVHRPRLSRLLDDAMNHPVTLLTAPPGWGKTAGLRSWLDHRADPGPVIWLSPHRTGSVSEVANQVTAFAAAAAGAPGNESSGGGTGPAVVILDDVGWADPGEVSRLLSDLQDTVAAPGERVRLMLTTRDDSFLPVPRWRLDDKVAEIGCAELAFTLDETADMLAAQGTTLPTPEIEALHTRAEGWPAGIRFAALRADAPDPLTDERHDVARYLEAELLSRLPDRIRELLRRTSVLDRVSADLADTLLADSLVADSLPAAEPDQAGPSGGSERDLEELSAAGGFVLALGGTPVWYRYHHQFRETLRADLRRTHPTRIGQLHGRAARWLSRNGMPVDAIRHAWASGDRSQLASLGEAQWADLALAGCHVTDADRDPTTTGPCEDADLAPAYVVDRLGHRDPHAADTGLDLMDRTGQSTMVIRALRLARDRLDGDLTGIESSAAAVLELTDVEDQRDPEYAGVRAVALSTQAAGRLGTGDLAGAGDSLAASTAAMPDDPTCARRFRVGTRSLLLAVSGQLRGAEQEARSALAMPPCVAQPRDVHCEPAYLALALVSHECNRLAEADRFFDLAGRSRRLTVEPELGAWATLIGTWLRAARGDLTSAFDTLSAGRARAGGNAPRLQPWFAAAEAELRIARGDTATARATLTALLADPGDATAGLSVLLARALLHDGDPHAAARALPPWSDDEKADTVLSVRLDAGLVDAQVARTLGDRRRAAQILERVLDLAEPHGFRRPFSKDAGALRDLLADQLESGTAHWSTVSALVDQPSQRPPAAEAVPCGEALTEREITVLRYLQSMLSNEEIAAKLFVSVNTVKTHVRHIYRKLDVGHRRDAVRRAREVHLL